MTYEQRKPVLSKADFVGRYAAGEFGNASPTWRDYRHWDMYRHRHDGRKFHIRNRVAGGPTYYNLDPVSVHSWWRQLVDNEGVLEESLYISEMCPTERTLFQGEVKQTEPHSGRCGLDLLYTTVAKPMRDALAEKSQATSGIIASLLLRHYLCPNSYEWLTFLLEAYPYHVVEFTTLSTQWGTVPGYNTLFWEVRQY